MATDINPVFLAEIRECAKREVSRSSRIRIAERALGLNREGNGIPSSLVVKEVQAVGLTYVQTIQHWPTGDEKRVSYLTLFRKP